MKTPIALKLDFKIDEKGILRIFDIGDGLGAGLGGFKNLGAIRLRDLAEVNKSRIATVFGELTRDAMQPETIHIPIIQRTISPEGSWIDIEDLSELSSRTLLPYSQASRIQSYVSYFWGNKLNNIPITPMALMALEMHKLLWYTLMQKHMAPAYRENILYWSNDNSTVKLDLRTINMNNGVFIKIADRSLGGGYEIYYAKDANEVEMILAQLHKKYLLSTEDHAKHIFVIEPAYQTIKTHDGKDYNVTGRAFVTLIFDTETRELQAKIAGAKWMLPTEPMQNNKTQEQMLSNVKHSCKMLPLNEEELEIVSRQIVEVYGAIFKAGITHDDLMEHCNDNPIIPVFKSILKSNATYKLMLECSKPGSLKNPTQPEEYLRRIIIGVVVRDDLLNDFSEYLTYLDNAYTFFASTVSNEHDLISAICFLSFYERFAIFIKTCDESYTTSLKVVSLLQNESLITKKLDSLIRQFLQKKNKSYDLKDMNRALRQAAHAGDLEVLKILIGTHRASVTVCSPKTNQTALDFAQNSKCDPNIKESCIQLLKLNGAQSMQEMLAKEKTVELR
ncbi:MAG: hypothetical protein AB7F64_00550 [Gammaproteobacteria bacterium]